MAKITIRAKNLRTIIQKVKDLHTHNITLNIARGKLIATISGYDSKGKDSTVSIVIE